jgi:hypothetical protein
MMKVTLLLTAVVVVFLGAQAGIAQAPARTPVPSPFDGIESDLGKELTERIAQRGLILDEQASLGKVAKPWIDEQKGVSAKAAPFVQIEKSIEARDKNFGINLNAHKGVCHAGELQPGPYKTCLEEHAVLEKEATNISTDLEYNDKNLAPLREKYQRLERKIKPYLDAYASLAGKLKSIEKEIVRLDKILQGLETCKQVSEKAKREGSLSQLELETLHLCESIVNDNANPNRLLKDPVLAALDPNLPPVGWSPPRLEVHAGNKP